MNDARRRVERALMVTDAADELAQAAEGVVGPADAGEAELARLREALVRYRALRGA